MPQLTKFLVPLGFVAGLAGCQERVDPMPVAFSRSENGSIVAEVPLCAGDVLLNASVGAKFGDTYQRSGNGDPERTIEQDTILLLDLSAESVVSGSLTDEFPALGGSQVAVETPVPGALSFGVDTSDYSAFVKLEKVDPPPGQVVLVIGEVTRANEDTSLEVLTPVEAESVISNWCSAGRYDAR